MKAEIEAFLDLLKSPDGDERKRLQALADTLDRLALAYSDTADVFDNTGYPQALRDDYQMLAGLAHAAFPALNCYYPFVDPMDSEKQEVVLGGGIDDVADIAGDLSEVLWRLDHTSVNDAVWYFRFSYEHHWGQHLHKLRLLVFVKLHA